MNLPFSLTDFLNVFKDYNQSVFPLQFAFYFIAFLCVYILFTGIKNLNRKVSIVLSFFWLWMGIVYHIIFFSEINKAAYIFGGLFILQGIMFAGCGLIRKKLSFEYTKSAANIAGIILIAYALIIYPVLGTLLGHAYPYSPTFGLPCPTTIFTFGILLFTSISLKGPCDRDWSQPATVHGKGTFVGTLGGQAVTFDVNMAAKHEQDWVAHGQSVIQDGDGLHGILRMTGFVGWGGTYLGELHFAP